MRFGLVYLCFPPGIGVFGRDSMLMSYPVDNQGDHSSIAAEFEGEKVSADLRGFSFIPVRLGMHTERSQELIHSRFARIDASATQRGFLCKKSTKKITDARQL